MDAYYVNKNAQSNGEHEVHKNGCIHMSDRENRVFLGYFGDCSAAIQMAKTHYSNVDGCYYCCRHCHTREGASTQSSAHF